VAVAGVQSAIEAAKAYDTVGLNVWDSSGLQTACDGFKSCTADSEKGSAKYSAADTFCKDFATYVRERSSAENVANLLRSSMGFGCPDDSLIGESNGIYYGIDYQKSDPISPDVPDVGTGPSNNAPLYASITLALSITLIE
jgi:hypothetical protein